MIATAALVGMLLGAAQTPAATEVHYGRMEREHTVLVSSVAPFYAPAIVTIEAGETVHWRSGAHAEKHSVREALHGTFSLEIAPGSDVSHQFKRAGEYPYRCRFHPWMAGKIVVEPKKLAVQWQSAPASGRVVSGQGGAFVIGPGARPAIARLDRGNVVGNVVQLGSPEEPVRSDVKPVVAADGSLWFAGQAAGKLVRFPGKPGVFEVTGVIAALAAAPDGAVAFFDRSLQRIGRLVPETGDVSWIDAPVVRAMSAATDGSIWLITEARGKIVRVDGEGAVVEFTIPPTMTTPDALLSLGGDVWILDEQGRIARMTGGQIEEYVLEPSIANEGDLAAGSRGELWLLDGEARRIGNVDMEVRTLARLR